MGLCPSTGGNGIHEIVYSCVYQIRGVNKRAIHYMFVETCNI